MSSIRNYSILIIISSIVNILQFYNIELTLNVSNLMLFCISISTSIFNYIIFNDLHFEIKNNLNLYLYPNYYPSNKKINQYILIANSFVFFISSSFYIYYYWINMDYNNPELFKVFCMAIFTLLVISCSIIILHYAFTEIFTLASILINNMLFNYTHNLPLFANS